MLSNKLQQVAEYYVLAGINRDQVEELTKMKFEELPQEFHEYCQQIESRYRAYCKEMQQEVNDNLHKI